MNKVILIGRLVKDPSVAVGGNSGTSIARFNVAVDRKFKRDGDADADFISCVAFGKTAEFIEKYFKKGMRIGLGGRIQTGSYEKNGAKVYTTDVVVESAEFVESKGTSTASKPVKKNDDFMNIPDDIEEEMPFK